MLYVMKFYTDLGWARPLSYRRTLIKGSAQLSSSKIKKNLVLSVRFKNLCISHVGILSWGNLIYTNSYIDFSVHTKWYYTRGLNIHHTVLYYSEPQWKDTLLPSFLTCSSGTTTMTFLVEACLWNSLVLYGEYLTLYEHLKMLD